MEVFEDSAGGVLAACSCGNFGVFCSSPPNTSGQPARILYSGSGSISADDSVLQVTDAPPGVFGLFFHGSNPLQGLPIGDGILCGGGNQRRMPIVVTDAQGSASFQIDFGLHPQIRPDEERHFQFYFRDLGPSLFDLSDGMTVAFCP